MLKQEILLNMNQKLRIQHELRFPKKFVVYTFNICRKGTRNRVQGTRKCTRSCPKIDIQYHLLIIRSVGFGDVPFPLFSCFWKIRNHEWTSDENICKAKQAKKVPGGLSIWIVIKSLADRPNDQSIQPHIHHRIFFKIQVNVRMITGYEQRE